MTTTKDRHCFFMPAKEFAFVRKTFRAHDINMSGTIAKYVFDQATRLVMTEKGKEKANEPLQMD